MTLVEHGVMFTCIVSGGDVLRGQVVGATDLLAIDKLYHVRDIHMTIVHQLGLDQHQLTDPQLGRNKRLTFVEGKLIGEIV